MLSANLVSVENDRTLHHSDVFFITYPSRVSKNWLQHANVGTIDVRRALGSLATIYARLIWEITRGNDRGQSCPPPSYRGTGLDPNVNAGHSSLLIFKSAQYLIVLKLQYIDRFEESPNCFYMWRIAHVCRSAHANSYLTAAAGYRLDVRRIRLPTQRIYFYLDTSLVKTYIVFTESSQVLRIHYSWNARPLLFCEACWQF